MVLSKFITIINFEKNSIKLKNVRKSESDDSVSTEISFSCFNVSPKPFQILLARNVLQAKTKRLTILLNAIANETQNF